jgi:hypothetical protein
MIPFRHNHGIAAADDVQTIRQAWAVLDAEGSTQAGAGERLAEGELQATSSLLEGCPLGLRSFDKTS